MYEFIAETTYMSRSVHGIDSVAGEEVKGKEMHFQAGSGRVPAFRV